jgi:hypothetical protein
MNSAPTRVSCALELQAYTSGSGVRSTSRACHISEHALCSHNGGLANFIVATSLAVVKCGRPEFGFGILATTSFPLSMESSSTLLYMPSGYFLMLRQRSAFTVRAACCASSFTLNVRWRCASSCCSLVTNRPFVKFKTSAVHEKSVHILVSVVRVE